MTIKILIFVLLSIGFVYLSWPSLRDRFTYGFYRFFAFETLLGLFLVNIDHWFADPFSSSQLLSWILLIGSMPLAIHGFWLLRTVGRPRGSIEDTTELVVSGAYRYIRHPLYASLLMFAGGVFFKAVSLTAGLLLALVCVFMTATARFEERLNLVRFGRAYEDYRKRTKMFIPFIF
jgi:protein-S-isoprenylcysteine O-methyltransferase Ste14